MKKHIIISALLLSMLGVFAQNATDPVTDFGPKGGEFSGAVLFGRGSFLNTGLDVPSAPWKTDWTVSGSAPYLNSDEAGSNTITNMLGVEGRYFVTSKHALKFSGGAIYRTTPPRNNVSGVIDPSSPNAVWIPAYEAVEGAQNVDFNFNLGFDFLLPSKKFERLFPYVGFNIPSYYARRSLYDPTITDEGTVVDVGIRHAEIYGLGLQTVAGVDYYLAKGVYCGFEFKPVSYVYTFNRKLPAPGLEPLEADAHTWSFCSQIYFKVGFRFGSERKPRVIPVDPNADKVNIVTNMIDDKYKTPVKGNLTLTQKDGVTYSAKANGKGVCNVYANPDLYNVDVEAKGYLPLEDKLDIRNTAKGGKYIYNLTLVKIEKGLVFKFAGINFETNSDVLTKTANETLNKLAPIFIDNPKMQVEVAGHTDNVGDAESNKALSLKRANAVAAYLKDKGVLDKQIVTAGYGQEKPITDNDSADNRLKNRRVEFTVLDY